MLQFSVSKVTVPFFEKKNTNTPLLKLTFLFNNLPNKQGDKSGQFIPK